MNKKIVFLLISIFALVGIVKADELPEYVLGKGETVQIDPAKPDDFSSTITYTSTNDQCVSVTSEGKMTGAEMEGECTAQVTAKAGDNSFEHVYDVEVVNKVIFHGNGGKATCSYEVPNSSYTWYLENDENDIIARSGEQTLVKEVFISDDTHTCTITKNGEYFAGWYTEATGGELVEDVTSFKEVTELYAHWSSEATPLKSIALTTGLIKDPINIVAIHKDGSNDRRNTIDLHVIATPYYAETGEITWSSLNPEIATVDAHGKVTAVAVGTAIIKAETQDESKGAIYEVRVTNNDLEIIILPDDSTVEMGSVVEFKIYQIGPLYVNTNDYVIEISDASIANFVDADKKDGKIKALKEGTVTITAKLGDSGATASTTLRVVKDIGQHHVGILKYMIKFEGGEGADANATMEQQAVYEGEETTINKNLFTKKGYVFAGWAVYIEKADGTRVAAKLNDKQMMYKDGEDISKLSIPEGATLVLVATWVTNPDTGAIVPLAIVSLGLIAIYLFFIKSRKFNKIGNI